MVREAKDEAEEIEMVSRDCTQGMQRLVADDDLRDIQDRWGKNADN